MKIVFFGTPNYTLPVIESLHKNFKSKSNQSPIRAVVTQPPRPEGRQKKPKYSSIDRWAHQRKIPIFYNSDDLIKENITADVGILASFGQILKPNVINYFPNGILNLHFSSLPKFRGASPVHAAIIENGKEIGISIIKLDEKLDHGPIVNQFKEEIKKDDTSESLRKRVFEISAEVLITLLPAYINGKITLKEQNHKNATFTRIITKRDGFIPPRIIKSLLLGKKPKDEWEISFIKDFSVKPNASIVERFIRAMDPWPFAWTLVTIGKEKKRLKLLKSHLEKEQLIIDDVQLEGKNKVSWEQFQQGYPNAIFE